MHETLTSIYTAFKTLHVFIFIACLSLYAPHFKYSNATYGSGCHIGKSSSRSSERIETSVHLTKETWRVTFLSTQGGETQEIH
jgi:hypothetical protein